MMRFVGVVCLLASCLAWVEPVSAQISTGGSVRGHVKDEQEAVLPGTRLTAVSPDAPNSYTTTSDDSGYYRLLDLPPGEYTITAELDGFAKWVREAIVVRSGLNLTIPVVLSVSRITETIEVRPETPMLETARPVQAVNVSGELQRNLPLSSRRDWSDFLLVTPGVVSTTLERTVFYVHGSTQDSHVFQVDGADVMSALQSNHLYMYLSTEAIADVQVKTAAVDAASPLGLGAIVNVATVSGTDRLMGSFGVGRQPRQWNSNNNPLGTTSSLALWQPELSAGGPLRRGRSWLFGSYRWSRQETGVPRSATQLQNLRIVAPNASLPETNINNGHFFFAKHTTRLSSRHHLQLLYSHDKSSRTSAAERDVARFLDTVTGGPVYSARVSSTWSDQAMTQATFTYNEKGLQRNAYRGDVPGRVVYERVLSTGGRLAGVNALAQLDNTTFGAINFPASKYTIAFDTTFYKSGWAGTHEIQTGVFAQPRVHDEWQTTFHNNGFVLEDLLLRNTGASTPELVPFHRQMYGVPELTTLNVDTRDTAIYAQNLWRPTSNFTVSGGVRIDWVRRHDNVFDEVTQRSTEIGPRFGVTFLLTEDARNVLRASWGRVHESLSVNETTAGTRSTTLRDLYDLNLDGVFETELVTPGRTAAFTDRTIDLDHYHQAHVDEVTAGYRRQWHGQWATDLGFTRREYRNLRTGVDTNGIYEDGVFRGYRDERVNQVYRVTDNVWNWPVYSSVEARVTKQSQWLQLIGGYVRQWRHMSGRWQPLDPASFIQPGTFENDKGLGVLSGSPTGPGTLSGFAMTGGTQWRDHVATLAAALDVRGWNVASLYTFRSGMWTGPIVTSVTPDPRFGSATVTLSNGRVASNPLATPIRFAFADRGEGQRQSPNIHQLNLRLGRSLRVGHARVLAALDVINVMNKGSDETWSFAGANQLFSAAYLQTSNKQAPRMAQISCRVRF